jgi:nitrate reductase (cytochrome)
MPGIAFGRAFDAYVGDAAQVTWKKAPCNLCGVGCGLLVGIEGGRAVAVRGDPASPVNRGLACVKGYHGVQALYGRDRLTRAYIRRDGRLVPVPMREALDLVAQRLGEAVAAHGKDSVAIYGSGQWTMPAGYAAAKLFKGGIGTNNVEAEPRLSMGSAASALRSSFGTSTPVGCYEDIDHADVFIIWGTNLAETHPVLFSRLLERRRRDARVRIIELATRTTRTSYAADRSLLLAPQSELAVANAICQELVARGRVAGNFVERHVAFRKGRTDIGYGEDDDVVIDDDAGAATWSEYVRFLDAYTPEEAQKVSSLAAADIAWLAAQYGDRSRNVMSLWSAGLNRHTRGAWANNLIYNIHLLTGRIAAPGNGALPLADEASAWGTVAEVGTLTDALPRGVVTDAAARERAARIWAVPADRIAERPTHRALSMFRALDRGEIRFLWIQGANPMVMLPDLRRYRAAALKDDRFIVVSDAYPTPTTDVADVVLPAALWIEQEGLFGNAERRTQHFEQMLTPPGEAMGDAWQLIEVARRLGHAALFPWDRAAHVAGLWNEYARFHDGPDGRATPLEALKSAPGMLWPHADGAETKWRFNTEHDAAADSAAGAYDFYGHADHRARIWLRPYEPPAERPDAEYPYRLGTGAVLEHSGAGSLTRRIPVLHRAVPGAWVEMNAVDAGELGIRDGERVRLVSRRGALVLEARINYRSQPARGHVFVPEFDENLLINELTSDAHCPLSGTPGQWTCVVRVERVGGGAAQ